MKCTTNKLSAPKSRLLWTFLVTRFNFKTRSTKFFNWNGKVLLRHGQFDISTSVTRNKCAPLPSHRVKRFSLWFACSQICSLLLLRIILNYCIQHQQRALSIYICNVFIALATVVANFSHMYNWYGFLSSWDT